MPNGSSSTRMLTQPETYEARIETRRGRINVFDIQIKYMKRDALSLRPGSVVCCA